MFGAMLVGQVRRGGGSRNFLLSMDFFSVQLMVLKRVALPFLGVVQPCSREPVAQAQNSSKWRPRGSSCMATLHNVLCCKKSKNLCSSVVFDPCGRVS